MRCSLRILSSLGSCLHSKNWKIGETSLVNCTAALENFKIYSRRFNYPPSGYVCADGSPFFPSIMSELHFKCRFPNQYTFKDKDGQTKRVARQEVPAGYVSWDIPFDMYDPITFDASFLSSAPWADPLVGSPGFQPKFNELDGNIERRSHEGPYRVYDGKPLNNHGRTGLKGRGILGRYGPNHAADPIVTRWSRDPNTGEILIDPVSKRNILEFVAIKRKDNGEWAIPGGMVDPGEAVSVTVRREFMEEALDSTGSDLSEEDKLKLEHQVADFFKNGKEIYKGYVDDPRNTDNSWMETVAFLFHDDTGEKIGRFDLKAGDDAKDLKWIKLSDQLELYASHKEFLKKAAFALEAHW